MRWSRRCLDRLLWKRQSLPGRGLARRDVHVFKRGEITDVGALTKRASHGRTHTHPCGLARTGCLLLRALSSPSSSGATRLPSPRPPRRRHHHHTNEGSLPAWLYATADHRPPVHGLFPRPRAAIGLWRRSGAKATPVTVRPCAWPRALRKSRMPLSMRVVRPIPMLLPPRCGALPLSIANVAACA